MGGNTHKKPVLFVCELYANDTVKLVMVTSGDTVGRFILWWTDKKTSGSN